jgi:hypothetical protein
MEGLEQRTLLSVPPLGPEFRVNTTTAGGQTTVNNHRSVASDAAGNSVIFESGEGVPAYGPLLYAQRINAAGVKVDPEIHGGKSPESPCGPGRKD